MILTFQGGNEFIKLNMDRETKSLIVTSKKTNYDPAKTAWQKLFDPGKEKKQEAITDLLDDKEFKEVIIAGMQELGYAIKKVED